MIPKRVKTAMIFMSCSISDCKIVKNAMIFMIFSISDCKKSKQGNDIQDLFGL